MQSFAEGSIEAKTRRPARKSHTLCVLVYAPGGTESQLFFPSQLLAFIHHNLLMQAAS